MLMPDTRIFDLAVVDETWAPARVSSDPLPLVLKRCSLQREVRLSDGTRAAAEEELAWAEEADLVLVPGRGDPLAATGIEYLESLQRAYANGATVASLCSGAITLAAAGLLDGRKATTHWALAPQLAEDYPEIAVDASALFVGSGRVWTSAGVAAGIDLSIELLRNFFGAHTATAISRSMVMAPHRSGDQAQFMQAPVSSHAQEGQVWTTVSSLLEGQPSASWSNAALARACCMSERSFLRRFQAETGTSPKRWITHWRINEACRRLEETDDPIAAIARAVGYGTPVAFRQRFRAMKGVPPLQNRASFRRE